MGWNKAWHKDTEADLIALWKQGVEVKDIAAMLGKSRDSVRMYASRHRERLGLDVRTGAENKSRKMMSELDRQWQGPVPFGHWSITKPWGTGNAETTYN